MNSFSPWAPAGKLSLTLGAVLGLGLAACGAPHLDPKGNVCLPGLSTVEDDVPDSAGPARGGRYLGVDGEYYCADAGAPEQCRAMATAWVEANEGCGIGPVDTAYIDLKCASAKAVALGIDDCLALIEAGDCAGPGADAEVAVGGLPVACDEAILTFGSEETWRSPTEGSY